jgi:hypothetical protein
MFKQIALVAAAAALISGGAGPAHAFFTECTAVKNVQALDRPQGIVIGRFAEIKTGEKLAVRDTYQDWAFVLRYDLGREQYGWVRQTTLDMCTKRDGTP